MSGYVTAILEEDNPETLRAAVIGQRDEKDRLRAQLERERRRGEALSFALAILVVLNVVAIVTVAAGVWAGWW